ncbi:penicillin-binding protein 1C [Myroides sp. LJL116]
MKYFFKIVWSSPKKKAFFIIGIILGLLYAFCLPNQLFNQPYSSVILSKDGHLLGAKIANDGQWRFAPTQNTPYKFETALRLYEDQYFYLHWGINPLAISKAFIKNLQAKQNRFGASTLTQQTIRLHHGNQKRTYWQKIKETIQATRLEFTYSKKEILNLYSSHAPFGGNVVGLDMAAWRYYGITPDQLSWSQAATLAVLPNAPSLINPGKNRQLLLKKRNILLEKLLKNKIIDSITYVLAIEENLVEKPHNLPNTSPHLLELIHKKQPQQTITTTIDYPLQMRANEIVAKYYKEYKESQIHNISVLITDIKTNAILAYVGNSPTDKEHQKDVDNILSLRSTGSTLKPFLSMAQLDQGEILPHTLVKDIPIVISGYKPLNFSSSYNGAVPHSQALSRSLNIPFVLMLQDFGVARFYHYLQNLGFTSINKHPNHYGLSLILGGAESSLWQITRAYTNLAYTLNYYNESKGSYPINSLDDLVWQKDKAIKNSVPSKEPAVFGAGPIYQTFTALTKVNRPEDQLGWQYFNSAKKIAWKTGTSFGARDAWAVGIDKNYVISVWVGNSTGEGRPSLSGVRLAGPILFDLFNLMPKNQWFETPFDDLEQVQVCTLSGYIASELCDSTTQLIPIRAKKTGLCPYHQLVHLEESMRYQVNTTCQDIQHIVSTPWFVLPPTMAYYYRQQNNHYKELPPWREDCIGDNQKNTVDFIYPKHNDILHLTRGFSTQVQPFTASAATSKTTDTLYWYLDQKYLGNSVLKHNKNILADPGKYTLRIVNQNGDSKAINIQIGNP